MNTLALSHAQHYVLAELRMAYANDSEADTLRAQIGILEQAFRQPLNRSSLQQALREIRSQRLSGPVLVGALTELYHLHNLDALCDHAGGQVRLEDDDELPRVVCSEGLLQE